MAESSEPTRPSMGAVAAESPEESVEKEREATGDQPDVGGTVPKDDSQSAPS